MTVQRLVAPLRPRWHALQRAFDARPSRERLVLAAGIVAVALCAVDALWLSSAFRQWSTQRGAHRAAQLQLESLQREFDRAQAQGLIDDRRIREQLAQLRTRLRDGDDALRRHEASLIGPERMLELLQQLLARHGELRVRAMQSLPKVDVLAADASSAGAPALYRHGVELQLEGRYADLLAWLQAIESLPQRLQWGELRLAVEQHPRCVLTLRLYTLSLDRRWLEI